MRKTIAASLITACLALGTYFALNFGRPDRGGDTPHLASNYSIINLNNDMMEGLLEDGTYQSMIEDSDSQILFRVHSGGPTRLPAEFSVKGSLQIINPAGIIVGSHGDYVPAAIDFDSTLEPYPVIRLD